MKEKVFDLEDRLVNFSAGVTGIVELLPDTKFGNYISGQLIRCGCAPALYYGEAQSAESRDDFIHKMKIILKELKETRICLKLIQKKDLVQVGTLVADMQNEGEELIRIISKSIQTAKQNNQKPKRE